jgi:hypothetical protein
VTGECRKNYTEDFLQECMQFVYATPEMLKNPKIFYRKVLLRSLKSWTVFGEKVPSKVGSVAYS